MDDIIKAGNSNELADNGKNTLIELSDSMLAEVRTAISTQKVKSVPIAELSTLGAGVSSLLPALNTVTQTTTMPMSGLYQVANKGVGDALKIAKNGNAWGALKTAAGGSKMAQFSEVGSITSTTELASAFNPATMMMAVALYSIEKQMKEIVATQKQILDFLEIEKESEIEGDVETLSELITNYKHNWDNEMYLSNNHMMVLEMKRRARSNMISYQKKVNEIVATQKLLVAQSQVNATYADLEKKFKYYRLCLYNFSLASMLEIMLGGNYVEEYIGGIKDEIIKLSNNYSDLYDKGSKYLAKLGSASVEKNVLKGIGVAGKAVGKFIGSIPLVKEGQVDEFLQGGGYILEENAIEMEKRVVEQFASISDSRTDVFIEKMDDMIQIYNHTQQICFDKDNIYMITG